MKLTSLELAKLCGVSRATVDRVFNNRGKVQEETRKKIIETANSIGYRPNYIAQSLATGKTLSIGLIVPSLNNYFFSTLLDAIARKAMEYNYIILVSLYENNPDFEYKCISNLIDRQVDGLILFSTSNTTSSIDLIKQYKVPTVLLLNEVCDLPCVSIDYRQAMYDATNYVISKNYNNLIFLCPPLEHEKDRNIFAIKQRHMGFMESLDLHKDKNITNLVIGSSDYLDKINSIRFDHLSKTAILCSSDIYALEVIRLLKTKGVNIPQDVGVMGFDGIDIISYLEPSVATVSIPIAQVGETAAQHLIDVITKGFSATELTLPYAIKPGNSIV